MKVHFNFKAETKTCYRFERGERPDLETIYLKKSTFTGSNIDPKKGITVTVEQGE